MKHTLTYSLQVILLSLLFLLPMSFSVQPVATIAQQPVTEIYIIRHAEKDTSNKADKDPNLSAAGKKRADALKKFLKKKKPAAAFSTDYKRTRQTLQPLVQALGMEVQAYDATNLKNLAEKVLKDYKGKTVVIAGHSNTILETVEVFGVDRPMEKIEDSEYDYIFRITVENGEAPKLKIAHYGKKAHIERGK